MASILSRSQCVNSPGDDSVYVRGPYFVITVPSDFLLDQMTSFKMAY